MQKFEVGDKVKVTSGKDKGRDGTIEKIFPKKGTVLIPGLNLYKKHVKGFQGQKGGVYDIPRTLPYSKIALICPRCKRQTRVGFKIVGTEKVRTCRKCKKEISVNKGSKRKN
jgi:large subunit ribosomal protein L24